MTVDPAPPPPGPADVVDDASYTVVDQLVVRPPLVVAPTDPVGDVARWMGEAGVDCAAVPVAGGWGLLTDARLRETVVARGAPADTPVGALVGARVPVAHLGDAADEALLTLLEADLGHLLVLDAAGAVRGVVVPRDFVVSPATGGLSLQQRLARATTASELVHRAAGMPAVLGRLVATGSTAARAVAVYSAMVDTVVRRALAVVFAGHRDLSLDAFTWLSLGSNGRREAVPSSDVDSAVAFDDAVGEAAQAAYRVAFTEVHDLLRRCGLASDAHGAVAGRAVFARTHRQWRRAAQGWLAAPGEEQGVVMTSLLVDGRPIHGDPGLPAVTRVFEDLRDHPATMRLMLREALSHRSRARGLRDVLGRRVDTVDVKAHVVAPVVNIARWAALAAHEPDRRTPARLRAAAGTTMLPVEQAETLVEAHEVALRLRLRHQLAAWRAGRPVGDVLDVAAMTPIDRSTLGQAVREIAAVQRRMDTVVAYTPAELWTRADTG